MEKPNTATVFAVPCDQIMLLSDAQGEVIISEIKKNHVSDEDKKHLADDVKVLFTKPAK